MEKFFRFVDKLSMVLCRIASVIFFVIVMLVAVNIVGRKLFNTTISGMIEIVQYGVLLVMVLSMARTTLTGGHVTVSIITGKLPKLPKRVIDVFDLVLSAVLVGIAAWVCMRYIPQTRASGLTTERYKIPLYLVYTVMSIGLVVTAFTFILNLIRLFYPDAGMAPVVDEADEMIQQTKEALKSEEEVNS